jgi:hypothetical protein
VGLRPRGAELQEVSPSITVSNGVQVRHGVGTWQGDSDHCGRLPGGKARPSEDLGGH